MLIWTLVDVQRRFSSMASHLLSYHRMVSHDIELIQNRWYNHSLAGKGKESASSENIRVRVGVTIFMSCADCIRMPSVTWNLFTLSRIDRLHELLAWPSYVGFGLYRFVEKSVPHLKLAYTLRIQDRSTFSDIFDSDSWTRISNWKLYLLNIERLDDVLCRWLERPFDFI